MKDTSFENLGFAGNARIVIFVARKFVAVGRFGVPTAVENWVSSAYVVVVLCSL
jgi:hypothetical protein